MPVCEHYRQLVGLDYARCLDCHAEVPMARAAVATVEEPEPVVMIALTAGQCLMLHELVSTYGEECGFPRDEQTALEHALER